MTEEKRFRGPCPCGGRLSYERCCQRWHDGGAPSGAEALMRSRYSAFVLKLEDYRWPPGIPRRGPRRLGGTLCSAAGSGSRCCATRRLRRTGPSWSSPRATRRAAGLQRCAKRAASSARTAAGFMSMATSRNRRRHRASMRAGPPGSGPRILPATGQARGGCFWCGARFGILSRAWTLRAGNGCERKAGIAGHRLRHKQPVGAGHSKAPLDSPRRNVSLAQRTVIGQAVITPSF